MFLFINFVKNMYLIVRLLGVSIKVYLLFINFSGLNQIKKPALCNAQERFRASELRLESASAL